jgi:ASC-1-like (ASCH) protein
MPQKAPTPSFLHLNLRREWFAAIASNRKKIEYRDRTAYWKTRLENRRYDAICFRNGYATKAPEMWVEWRGVRKYGTARHGYYAIRLGRILRIKRWRG